MPAVKPLPNYIFGFQGVLLLANGIYTLLCPEKTAETGSPLAGTPIPVVHAMRLAPIPSFPLLFPHTIFPPQLRNLFQTI